MNGKNVDSNGNNWEMIDPIKVPEGTTHYDVYYADAGTGFGIGTGDRFTVTNVDGDLEHGLVIAIQTSDPWKITALMDDGPCSIVREFMPTDITEVFPKPKGTR
jgi:hypothetical protein